MANQPSPPTAQPPPDLPAMSDISDTLSGYLRTFSLWCRNGFADKLSATSALKGIPFLGYDAPAGAAPNVYQFEVSNAGVAGLAPVPPAGTPGAFVPIGSVGVTNGSNAPAGAIGEILSVQTSSAVTLPNAIATSVISLTLTPGDWDLHGELWMVAASGGVTTAAAAINTSVALPGGSQPTTARSQLSGAVTASGGWFTPLQTVRVSISAATIYYLIGFSAYPSGTTTAGGCLWARRMR